MKSLYDEYSDFDSDTYDEIDDDTDTQFDEFDCEETDEEWGPIRKAAAVPAFGYLVYVGYQLFMTRTPSDYENLAIDMILAVIAMLILGISGSGDVVYSSSDSSDEYHSDEWQRQADEEARSLRASSMGP